MFPDALCARMARFLILLLLMTPHALGAVALHATPTLVALSGTRVMSSPAPIWSSIVGTVLAVLYALALLLAVVLPHRGRLLALATGLGLVGVWALWFGVVLLRFWASTQQADFARFFDTSVAMWILGAVAGTHAVPIGVSATLAATALDRAWPAALLAPLAPLCAAVGMFCQLTSTKLLWGAYWVWEPHVISQAVFLGSSPLATAVLVIAVATRPVADQSGSQAPSQA